MKSHTQWKAHLLLGTLSAAMIGAGAALGPVSLAIAIVSAASTYLGAFFLSDRLILALNAARELPPDAAPGLHRTLSELSHRAGISTPRVYLISEQRPNAFATGRGPKRAAIAVTDGLLAKLGSRELRAVLAHEVAHIRRGDVLTSTILAAITAAVTSPAAAARQLASLLGGPNRDQPSRLQLIALTLVAPFAGALTQLLGSPSREHAADELAGQLSGDPEGLALALEKLARWSGPDLAAEPATAGMCTVSPFAGADNVLILFATHPPTTERVARLRRGAQASPSRFLPPSLAR